MPLINCACRQTFTHEISIIGFFRVTLQTMKKHINIRIILSICLLATFFACNHETMPEGIIDTATMTAFLSEAHLIEGYSEARRGENADTTREMVERLYGSLFQKYNITADDYDKSLDYYMHHPQMMEEIYSRVLANINKVKEQYPGAVAPPPDTALFNKIALQNRLDSSDWAKKRQHPNK